VSETEIRKNELMSHKLQERRAALQQRLERLRADAERVVSKMERAQTELGDVERAIANETPSPELAAVPTASKKFARR
jgi:chromosome segregation ATPase